MKSFFDRSEDTLAHVYASVIDMLSPLTTKEVYEVIVKEATELVDAEYGSIFIAKGKSLKRVYSSTPETQRLKPRKNGFTYKAFLEKKIYIVEDKEIVGYHPEVKKYGIHSIIIIPLIVNEEGIGVLTLQSKSKHHFDKKRIHILKLFGTVASLKIQHVELYYLTKKDLELKEQFLALASHEIKTPLSVVTVYSQLINKKIISGNPIKKEWVATIQNEINRITRIINEFLTIKHIRTRQYQFRWRNVSLSKLIKEIINEYSITYPHQELISNIHPNESIVVGDKDKLKQVLTNILNNAIKFSPEEFPVSISLLEEKNYEIIEVVDHGIGIDKDDIPYIFNPFYKGKHKKKEGMGMGLFLSKNIIIAHGGKVEIQSEIGHGTLVRVKLPKIHARA